MRILPTIYLGGASYYGALVHDDCEIEQWETFEKQTFRNRCLIRDPKGEVIRLSVPVGKAEHKQLTKDIIGNTNTGRLSRVPTAIRPTSTTMPTT